MKEKNVQVTPGRAGIAICRTDTTDSFFGALLLVQQWPPDNSELRTANPER
jgi:hypothetical protein